MQTEIIKITADNSKEVLSKASKVIRAGGLVVFPTETVYGLGADVFNEEALGKIFSAKGRPGDNPLIVHIGGQGQLKLLTDFVSPIQQKIIDNFWPGPLTIIFPKKNTISNIVSGGRQSIAIRMPSLPLSRALIEESGVPIAAPSANISGRPSSTTGGDAYADLLGRVNMIIDAGQSNIGVESTVIRVTDESVSILRPGAVTKEMLEKVVYPLPVIFAKDKDNPQVSAASPGTRYKHYAPRSRMILESSDKMAEHALSLQQEGKIVGIISTNQKKDSFKEYAPNLFVLGDRNNLEEISQSLFMALRFFDTHPVDVIICESFPEQGLGAAIMDRLRRASEG